MTLRAICTLASGSLLLSGCANFSPLASHKPLAANQSAWLVYDSSRRGAYVRAGADGTSRICAEPAPDTAYSFENSLAGKLKTPAGADGSVDAKLAATIAELAGRDNLVLIAREALFRICEMRANGDLPADKVFPAFQEVMNAIMEVAKFKQQQEQRRAEEAKAAAR